MSHITLMPRRPRPATRPPPKSDKPLKPAKNIGPKQKSTTRKPQPDSENDSHESALEENIGSASSSGDSENVETEDIDVDAPRVAQWVPDELDPYGSASDEEHSSDEEQSSRANLSHGVIVRRLSFSPQSTSEYCPQNTLQDGSSILI